MTYKKDDKTNKIIPVLDVEAEYDAICGIVSSCVGIDCSDCIVQHCSNNAKDGKKVPYSVGELKSLMTEEYC